MGLGVGDGAALKVVQWSMEDGGRRTEDGEWIVGVVGVGMDGDDGGGDFGVADVGGAIGVNEDGDGVGEGSVGAHGGDGGPRERLGGGTQPPQAGLGREGRQRLGVPEVVAVVEVGVDGVGQGEPADGLLEAVAEHDAHDGRDGEVGVEGADAVVHAGDTMDVEAKGVGRPT